MNSNQTCLAMFCKELGIEVPSFEDMNQTISIAFSDQLVTCLSIDDDGFVVFAKLGSAPENSPAFLEELLSANLFWRDTEGATLSLDPETRGVFLARKIYLNDTDDTASLKAAVERFVDLQEVWTNTLPSLLTSESSQYNDSAAPPPSQWA